MFSFYYYPVASSADNHQLKNAIYYQKKGYSYLIEEKFLSEKMTPLINKIYFNRLLLDQILIKQKKHSDKLVYENIKKELKKIFYAKN